MVQLKQNEVYNHTVDNFCCLYAPIDIQVEQPVLMECIRFRGRERRINIPQEIGIMYHDFGLFLLEDHSGARIRAIAHKHKDDAEQINAEVLEEWIAGKGKHPVTWKTLTQVLREIELNTLARQIESVKCNEATSDKKIKYSPCNDPVKRAPYSVPEGTGNSSQTTKC